MSSKELTDDDMSMVLMKGLNFAVAPRADLVKDTICGLEKSVKDLPTEEAEAVRGEVSGVL